MTLIIDAPVGPYSELADIRAWVEELERMRGEATDPKRLEVITFELQRAQRWIDPARPLSE